VHSEQQTGTKKCTNSVDEIEKSDKRPLSPKIQSILRLLMPHKIGEKRKRSRSTKIRRGTFNEQGIERPLKRDSKPKKEWERTSARTTTCLLRKSTLLPKWKQKSVITFLDPKQLPHWRKKDMSRHSLRGVKENGRVRPIQIQRRVLVEKYGDTRGGSA